MWHFHHFRFLIVRQVIGRWLRGRWHGSAVVQGLPCFSAGAGPVRSQWVEPAGAVGGVDPPSEGWAALSGEQGEETRRSMDGAAPAEDTDQETNRQRTKLLELIIWPLWNDSPLPGPHLSGRAALFGWINQELVEKVNSLRGRVRNDLLQWDCRILLKCDFIIIWQLHHFLEIKHQYAVMSSVVDWSNSLFTLITETIDDS